MAKFCGNCGAKLDDDAKVCGQCGLPLEGTVLKTPRVKVQDPAKQQKMQKNLRMAAIAVIAVVVLVFASKLVAANTGYNSVLKKTMKAYMAYDTEALADMASDVYYYYFNSDVEDYVAFAFKAKLNQDMDSFEASIGQDYKLSYEVQKTYKLSKRKMDSIKETLQTQLPDYDQDEMTEVVVADVRVDAKQGKMNTSKNISVIMSKENGKWKLLTID